MACQTCGYATRDPGEFHPHAFCVLVRAGYDPWDEFRRLVAQVGAMVGPGGDVSQWPNDPPLVTRTVAS